MFKTVFSLIVLSLCFSTMSFANLKQGKAIFEAKCMSCHVNRAENPDIPILQGQEPRYLQMALRAYASGDRPDHLTDGMMQFLAKKLSKAETKSVAKYLATSDPCKVKFKIDTKRDGFMDEFKAGRAKYTEARCMHCHSSFHHVAPRLMGQRAGYVKKTLEMYRDKKRGIGVTQGKDHGLEVMQRVAAKLSDEDITNLTTYISAMKLMRTCEL